MTRIDFYILAEVEEEARLRFACRLIDKALRLGNQIFVAARDEQQAQQLDQLLWTFRPESFVPHHLHPATNDKSTDAPVLIGWGSDSGDSHDLLVNLSDEVPGYFSRFERLIEVVCQDEKVLTSTRKHFAFYRDRGYPIQSNDMRKKA